MHTCTMRTSLPCPTAGPQYHCKRLVNALLVFTQLFRVKLVIMGWLAGGRENRSGCSFFNFGHQSSRRRTSSNGGGYFIGGGQPDKRLKRLNLVRLWAC